MKQRCFGALGALLLAALFMVLAPLASVALAAEPGMEIHVGNSEMDNVLVVTAKLTNVEPESISKGVWTYKIDGIGTRTESEGCAADCLTYFNLGLFETGREYTLTVTFDNADPAGHPQEVTATKKFIAPPPYKEPEGFGIRCSVDFDRSQERFYVYARLEGDFDAYGTWTYKEKGTGRTFRLTGTHHTSFLKIGNAPGKVEAEISFDGDVDGKHVIVSSICRYVKEGIKASSSIGSAGMEVTGTLVNGTKATGTWKFYLKDASGKVVKQGTAKTTAAQSASARFEQIKPGKYVLQIILDGTVSGKSRILKYSGGLTVSSGSGLPEDGGHNQSGTTPGDDNAGTTPDDDSSGITPDNNSNNSGGNYGGSPSGGEQPAQKPSIWFLAPFVLAIVVGIILWIWVYRKM